MADVELKNLTKTFSASGKTRIQALHDVSLTVDNHELLVLVGPSGCGKSTLLRLIAGLEAQDCGSIFIDGRDVSHAEPKDRDIAMVFQNYALYPHMTAFENMAFGLKLRKVESHLARDKVLGTAKLLGIDSLLNRHPKELSGGQRQRVALGRAIVRDPAVFLFDEPLSNLDARVRVQIRGELARLHQDLQATMIHVTHDQAEAMTLGDRIAIMQNGILQQVDTPLNVYQKPANRFVAGFIGEPPMNFLSGTMMKKGQALNFIERDPNGTPNEAGLTLELPGFPDTGLEHRMNQPIWLGVRPEHVGPGGGNDSASFPAQVILVEHLGSESLVHTRTRFHLVVFKCRPEEAPDCGDRVQLNISIHQLHLFDPETGIRLNPVD